MNHTDHNVPDHSPSTDARPMTLVMRGRDLPKRTWGYPSNDSRPLMFIQQVSVLQWAMSSRVGQSYLDVERVIIDRALTPSEFLDVLSSLAPEFRGEMLFISEGDSGYLSTVGPSGERVLCTMSNDDVQFYMDAPPCQFRIVAAA